VAVVALGVLVAAGGAVRDAVCRHPYFAVREVLVRGHRRLAPDAVRRAAGIEPGVSVWDVDAGRAERLLAREPWVRSVRVTRQLPHRVIIRLREEEPVAVLALAADGPPGPTRRPSPPPALHWIAASGRVVAPVGPDDPRDVPYVTGLAREDVDGQSPSAAEAIRAAVALLRAAAAFAAVSEIHIDRRLGLTLLPVRPAVPVALGWDGFAEKLARLPEILARWAGREEEIVGLSLVFADEVVVRTRGHGGRG
jgi:hypothetical protein